MLCQTEASLASVCICSPLFAGQSGQGASAGKTGKTNRFDENIEKGMEIFFCKVMEEISK